MTEEEKKEFEEFLKWKAEKTKRAEQAKMEEQTSKSPSQSSKAQTSKLSIGFFVLFAVGVVAVILFAIITSSAPEQSKIEFIPSEKPVVEEPKVEFVESLQPQRTITTWNISTSNDEMTDTKNVWASLTSDNFISQHFPYEGRTYAKLTVRYMKKYGNDVLLEITKGQIHGNNYRGDNYITVRFDDTPAKKYYFNEAADGSSDVIFINNKSDFIKRCKQAKVIKVEVPLFQEGRPIFTFSVNEPLVWPQ
ncbi:MAG: hypothetical protein IJ582_03555 [Prevotella sp.]|nr:hypothetical protein [Prevotella sp.]MBR1447120.1 hypothetical protein [Prevotella sp.]